MPLYIHVLSVVWNLTHDLRRGFAHDFILLISPRLNIFRVC